MARGGASGEEGGREGEEEESQTVKSDVYIAQGYTIKLQAAPHLIAFHSVSMEREDTSHIWAAILPPNPTLRPGTVCVCTWGRQEG